MKNLILTFLITFLSVNTYSIDINGEAYAFTGNVSSITLNESGGVINAVGQTGQYGKVWLTYNLKADNPGNPNQGSFSGRATAIDEMAIEMVLAGKEYGKERAQWCILDL